MALKLQKTDGGRQSAGFTCEKRDCTVRAVAVAADIPYSAAHELARRSGRKNGKGWFSECVLAEARKDGLLEFIPIPTGAHIGLYRVRYATLDQIARRHSKGRYVIHTHNHAMALIDGVIHDTGLSGSRSQIREIWEVRPVQKVVTPAPAPVTQAQINDLWARLARLEARV